MRKLKKALERKQGMSLIGTLLVGSLMLTLGFTAAAMTFSHYTLTNVADRQAVARSLAESAANRAIARCLADITYGTKGNIGDDVTVTLESAPGGWGKVYFGGSDVVAFGNIPRSNNFLAQDIPNQSNGRVVPSRSLHIIAIGQWGKTRRAVETIVSIPKFKYAIAATGQISSTGGLLVAGVKNPAAVENGVSHVPDDQWVPGCMMTNSADATAALDLDSGAANTKITGDVQAVGGIKLGANTVVEGSVKAFNSPEDVPKVEASDYDTASMAGCNTTIGANEMGLNVVGPARRAGDLTVTGGLTMDAGVLYVDGDVTVHGGLHGKGALISTGKVTINNQSTFEAADDQAAIVAQSDVKISGSNKDNCVYNGVVFTQGNFQANDVTLLGSLCAGKAGGSEVKLNEVNMLSNPISMDLQYSLEGALSEHVMNWRRNRSESVPDSLNIAVNGMLHGKVIDPALVPPITPNGSGEAAQFFVNPNGNQTQQTQPDIEPFLGVVDSSYYNGSSLSFDLQMDGNRIDTLGKTVDPNFNGTFYTFRAGDPTSLLYNSDIGPAWDATANDGAGGYTMEKYRQAFPLGLFDGNAKIKIDHLVAKDSYGNVGTHWAIEEEFNGRELYEGFRSLQDSVPKTYKLVNRDNPSQFRMVTLGEAFNPGGDAAANRAMGVSLAKQWWKRMNYAHHAFWQDPYPNGLPDPLPTNPWANYTTPDTSYSAGTAAVEKALASLTTFNKPQYKGSFNFNPLQFVQLRDQSQRMLWREYDPGA